MQNEQNVYKMEKRWSTSMSEIKEKLNSGKELIALTYEQLAFARNKGIFSIPAVQRGVVWSPLQVINLWDSIIKGYPIGSLMVYKKGDQWCLFDGQQRTISLCYGYDPDDIKIWCRRSYENNDIQFMATTKRHPWGYKWVKKDGHNELAVLTWKDREDALAKIFPGKDSFSELDINDGYPYDNKSEDGNNYYIPLEWLISYKEEEIESWDKYIPETENVELYKRKYRELAEDHRIRAIIDGKRQVPILIIPQKTIDNKNAIRELFYRINKGGTPLSKIDDLYSELCVQCPDVKPEIETLCGNENTQFLSASRLCIVAARMAMCKSNGYPQPKNLNGLLTQIENKEQKASFEKFVLSQESTDTNNGGVSFSNALIRLNNALDSSSRRAYKYILLRDANDSWFFVMIYLLCNIVSSNIEDDNKHIPLLACLPFLTCCTNSPTDRNRYAQKFYTGISSLEGLKPSLIHAIAVGYLHAALDVEHLVYPFDEDCSSDDLADSFPTAPYGTWADMFQKSRGRSENFALYLYQREYIHKLLGSYFNPSSPITWDDENRPWDMDHIIPDEWWNTQEPTLRDAYRDSFCNMQALHFHDNRSKSNASSGVPDSIHVSALGKLRLADNFNALKREDISTIGVKLIEQRRKDIVQSVLREASFSDLITRIECLKDETPLVKNARQRFELFCKIRDILCKEYTVCFAHAAYARNIRNTGITTNEMKSMLIDISSERFCFYTSLAPWLAVGVCKGNSIYGIQCMCTEDAQYGLHIQLGVMRGSNVTAEKWMSDEQTNDAWWKRNVIANSDALCFDSVVKGSIDDLAAECSSLIKNMINGSQIDKDALNKFTPSPHPLHL